MESITKQVQKLIISLNEDSKLIGSSLIPLFVFLWLYGQDEMQFRQEDLAKTFAVKKRTLRSQLYKLRNAGYISYEGHWDNSGKTIKLLKHRHDAQ